MSSFDLLNQYFALQEKIFSYFGYQEDWRAIPLDDRTDTHWMLFQKPDGQGEVFWSPEPFSATMIDDGSNLYSASIYTQRFLQKWVYVGKDFTMVCVDTHVDLNKFLMVFTNEKRCEDVLLLQQAKSCWGVDSTG